MKTRNITLCIPKETVKMLDEYHKKNMVPKSKLVAKLLEEFFEKKENK